MARPFGRGAAKPLALATLTLMLALATISGPSVAEAAKQKVRTPGPLRVLLVGDSLTGNYGPYAAAQLRLRGYQVTISSLGGSGLLDADKCHGRYAKRLLRTVEPDIVVYQNKGNYNLLTSAGVPPCRPLLSYGTPKFYVRWEKAARQSPEDPDEERCALHLGPQPDRRVEHRRKRSDRSAHQPDLLEDRAIRRHRGRLDGVRWRNI